MNFGMLHGIHGNALIENIHFPLIILSREAFKRIHLSPPTHLTPYKESYSARKYTYGMGGKPMIRALK